MEEPSEPNSPTPRRTCQGLQTSCPGMLPAISSCTRGGSALPLTAQLDLGEQRDIGTEAEDEDHPSSPVSLRGSPRRPWEEAVLERWDLRGTPEPQQLFVRWNRCGHALSGRLPGKQLEDSDPSLHKGSHCLWAGIPLRKVGCAKLWGPCFLALALGWPLGDPASKQTLSCPPYRSSECPPFPPQLGKHV